MAFNMIIGMGLGCSLLYILAHRFLDHLDRRRLSQLHNCKPVFVRPQLGLLSCYSHFKNAQRAAQDKQVLSRSLKRSREFGSTFQSTMLWIDYLTTTDPENVETILSTKFKDYGLGKRSECLEPLLGTGIFTAEGPHWETSRALLRPNFVKSQIANLVSLEAHVQGLIGRIPRDGSTIDLQALFFQYTLDRTTEFILGESINSMHSAKGSKQQAFADAFDYAQSQFLRRGYMGKFMWLYRNEEFYKACQIVHRFIDPFVDKALVHRRILDAQVHPDVNKPPKLVLLYELTKVTKNPKQLRDELINILLAGRDTTAGLLSNAFHVLSRDAKIWRRLKSEVDCLGHIPNYETLRGMRYLRMFLNEVLRLYPSVPNNVRVARNNTVLPRGGGSDRLSPIIVPKGTPVFFPTYSIHRSKDIYGEDADNFDPERWDAAPAKWGFIPFGGGPRACLGQQLALTETGYTIVRLLQEFDNVENRDSDAWIERLGMTLASGNGTKVSMC